MDTITLDKFTLGNENRSVQKSRSLVENLKIKFYQNRFLIFGTFSLVTQVLIIKNAYISNTLIKEEEKVYDEIAFVSNLQIADPEVNKEVEEEGEIKETEQLQKKEFEDPRIASAQNVFLIGATLPIDLTPDIKPEYPLAARKNGIEGIVTLEVVISDEGSVLKATAVNKPLGFGLEETAVSAFKRKKYQPSIYEGKPITVRVMVPVQFRLN